MKNFLKLSWREQCWFIKVYVLTGLIRVAILVIPFKYLSNVLGKHMQESPTIENEKKLVLALRIGWIVETVSGYTLWKSQCLVKAIAGKLLLRQYGIANTLYLGLTKCDGKIVAHAWLRCGEKMITGGQVAGYTVVGKFADDAIR